jgi:hypothetical protein
MAPARQSDCSIALSRQKIAAKPRLSETWIGQEQNDAKLPCGSSPVLGVQRYHLAVATD